MRSSDFGPSLHSRRTLLSILCTLGVLSTLFLSSCSDPIVEADAPPTAYDADKFDADPLATLWFDCAGNCILRSPGFSEAVAARTYAYLSIAYYEAILPGMPQGYRSLGGQLNGFDQLPKADTASKRFHWTICANAASADVLRAMFKNAGADVKKTIDSLEALCLKERFDRTHDTLMTNRSIAFGKAIAKAVISYADQDGGKDADIDNYATPFLSQPDTSTWVISSTHKNPLLAAWSLNRPLFLSKQDLSTTLDPGPYPDYSTDKSSSFYAQAVAVRAKVLSTSNDERALVKYWGNEAQNTHAVSSHMINIATQLLRTGAFPMGKASVLYARLAIAMNDACIATWNVKYKYPLMRPITYIQKYIDRSWQSDADIAKIYVPASPEYCSSTVAICQVALPTLQSFFGPGNLFTDRSRFSVMEMERDYYTFDQISNEVLKTQAESGTQYQFSISAGQKLGNDVAQLATQRVQFRY